MCVEVRLDLTATVLSNIKKKRGDDPHLIRFHLRGFPSKLFAQQVADLLSNRILAGTNRQAVHLTENNSFKHTVSYANSQSAN